MSRLVEITGIPGTGKTTFINEKFNDKHIIKGFLSSKSRRSARILCSIIIFVKIWYTGNLNKTQKYWIIKQFKNYEETLFFRINALRNAVSKLNGIEKSNINITLIDEGISHIPFLFHVDSQREITLFLKLFNNHLRSREIYYLLPPTKEEIYNRLARRGHQQANSDEKLRWVIEKNFQVHFAYLEVLEKTKTNYILIGP